MAHLITTGRRQVLFPGIYADEIPLAWPGGGAYDEPVRSREGRVVQNKMLSAEKHQPVSLAAEPHHVPTDSDPQFGPWLPQVLGCVPIHPADPVPHRVQTDVRDRDTQRSGQVHLPDRGRNFSRLTGHRRTIDSAAGVRRLRHHPFRLHWQSGHRYRRPGCATWSNTGGSTWRSYARILTSSRQGILFPISALI